MIFKGVNSIGKDAYFVRLKDKPDWFVHYRGEKDGGELFQVEQGSIGAAVFHKANARRFINETGINNLELVEVIEIIGTDSSMN